MVEQGTHERWDCRAGSRVRGVLLFVPLALTAFGIAAWMLVLATFAPAVFRRRRRGLLHAWGRAGLALSGVSLEAHGLEHLSAPGGRIVLFNHQSLLDLFVLTALWPERGVVVYKREFHRVPIIGRIMRELDLIAVDRSDRDRAIESMRAAGRRVRERGEVLLVAPEGTRSKAPGLLDFKRGPFHVAADTGLPAVLMVIRGVRELMPKGRLVTRTGRARVDVLAPVSTAEWDADDLDGPVAEVRAMFLRFLPDAGRAPPAATTGPGRPDPTGPALTAGSE